jgi:glycosyltransferase involved in cell wall biosynthesis
MSAARFPPWWPAPAPRPALAGPPPRLTVVTPSFNQAAYLEATIESVLADGYPNLEYFVMDGGSTDGSREIIERHAPRLAGWVSEKDRGQTDAIAKGLARATGDWFTWINSDDLLAPGALWAVAAAAVARDTDLIAGATHQFGDGGLRKCYVPRNISAETLAREQLGSGVIWQQPSTWFRRDALAALGINQASHYAFDYELMIRYTHRHRRVRYLNAVLAYFRLHETSKTGSQGRRFREEQVRFLRAMSAEREFADLQVDLERAARAIAWAAELDDLQARTHESRLARLRQLWAGVRADPGGRCTRYSRRIARRILVTGGRPL